MEWAYRFLPCYLFFFLKKETACLPPVQTGLDGGDLGAPSLEPLLMVIRYRNALGEEQTTNSEAIASVMGRHG